MLRPALAVERLEHLSGGRLAYRMKTPWRDGTTHVVMSDGELLEKLAALVPAPRFHLVRHFGILASAAKQRASVVPLPPPLLLPNPANIEAPQESKSRTDAIIRGLS